MEEFNIKIDTSDPACNSVRPSDAATLYMSIPNKRYSIADAPASIPFIRDDTQWTVVDGKGLLAGDPAELAEARKYYE